MAFSGGQGCLAVLKLIRNSLDDENNPKKVAYFPTVFIMDESGISEDNFEFNEVLELAKMFDFPIFVAHMSMVLKIGEESKGKVVTESTNYLSTSDLNKEGKLDTIVVFCYLFSKHRVHLIQRFHVYFLYNFLF